MSTQYTLQTAHPAPPAITTGLEQVTLPIKGMTCTGCVASIQLALADLAGVQDVRVDLKAGQAQVTYDAGQVGLEHIAQAVAGAGYQVDRAVLEGGEVLEGGSGRLVDSAQIGASRPASAPRSAGRPWRRPLLFGLLGAAGLLVLYLGLVSLAQGWAHAVELLAEDAWIVGPILAGFGVQVGLYTYLKTVIHAAARGTGALAGAGGGTSTAAMVACCAHHVTDVLPLVGLAAAATFLAEYRIPFMLVGLGTNLVGIGIIGALILRERRRLAECTHNAQPALPTPACH